MKVDDSLFSYVTAQLPDSTKLVVEVTPVRAGEDRERDVVSVDQIMSLTSIRSAIEGVSAVVLEALRSVEPSKASVEFGIEVGLDSGQLTAILVKGSTKANLKITLEWTNDRSAINVPQK